MYVLQQPGMLLEVPVLHQPALPLACLFLSSLCCHRRVCSKAAFATPGVSVLHQPVLPLACLFYSNLFCLCVSVLQAAFATPGVSVLQQPVLPRCHLSETALMQVFMIYTA